MTQSYQRYVKRIWNGTPAGYSPIEGDTNVLFPDSFCAQQIHTSAQTAETELIAVLRKRKQGRPFLRSVAARCPCCGNVIFINDLADLAAFAKSELLCSTCKERAFCELPQREQARRQLEAIDVWNDISTAVINQPLAGTNAQ